MKRVPKIQQFETQVEDALRLLHLKVVPTPAGASPLEMADQSYRSCDELLSLISAGLNEHEFAGPAQQLRFYKKILTEVIALKVFCRERYYIQVNCPSAADTERVSAYCKSQLGQLEAFEQRYGFFKGYYRSGMDNLDELYYLPGKGMQQVVFPEVSLPYELKLGAGTYLFARFRATELVTDFLLKFSDQVMLQLREASKIPVAKQSIVRTSLNLSVDQIGLMTRAALDAGLVAGKSFQQICQELAPRVATKGREQISAGSIRSNAYTGEDIDKHTLIRYLEKMIRLIREY